MSIQALEERLLTLCRRLEETATTLKQSTASIDDVTLATRLRSILEAMEVPPPSEWYRRIRQRINKGHDMSRAREAKLRRELGDELHKLRSYVQVQLNLQGQQLDRIEAVVNSFRKK